MPREKTWAQQMAARCVTDAKKIVGAGWEHIGQKLREGLVMREMVVIMLGQLATSASGDAMRDLARECFQLVALEDEVGELRNEVRELQDRLDT